MPGTHFVPFLRRSRWPSTHEYGINAVTGSTSRKPALTQAVANQHDTVRRPDEHELCVVRSVDDAKRILSYAVGDTLNLNPASWDTHYTPNHYLLQRLTCSQTSFTVVISRRRLWDILPVGQALTDEARRLLDSNPARFHDVYGHYYVHGLRRVDSLSLVLSFSFDNKMSCDAHAHAVQLSAQRQQILRSSFQNLASAYVVQVDGGHTTAGYLRADAPNDLIHVVDAAIDSFARARASASSGPPHFLLLRPFGSLPQLEAAPFREIAAIRDALVGARLVLNALPSAELRTAWDRFNARTVTWQSRLPEKQYAAHRARLLHDVQALERRARELDAVHTFWLRARSAREMEPAGGALAAPRADPLTTFGLVPTDVAPFGKVTVGVARNLTVHPRCLAGTRHVTVDLRLPDSRVVGWRVLAQDGRGRWWKESAGPIITTRGGVLALERDLVRKCRWQVTTFVVHDRDFDEFCRMEEL